MTDQHTANGRGPRGGMQSLWDGFFSGQRGIVSELPIVARPWWYDAPSVLLGCARVIRAPFRILADVAELAVSLAVLATIALGAAWYTGHVKDEDVVAALRPVGTKILGMVQKSADQH